MKSRDWPKPSIICLDRLQSSVNELRSVTDAIAPDLKSPLTSIRGALESVLSSEHNEKWRDYGIPVRLNFTGSGPSRARSSVKMFK